MSDYVTLMGAERVQNAGNAMRNAASDMQRAASQIEAAFERNQRFLDDWLLRLEDALNRTQEQRP